MKMHVFLISLCIIIFTSCPSPVTVKLTVRYIDQSKTPWPAWGVKVVLGSGDTRWTGTTDKDGAVSFQFSNNPGKVWYWITPENSLFIYSTNGCDQNPVPYEGTLGPFDGPVSNVSLDLTVGNFARAWYYLNQAAHAIPGFTMFQIRACPGSYNAFNQSNKTITLNLAPALAYLQDKVYHEYGHAVMYQAVGGKYDPGDCKIHQIGMLEDPRCAWVEGWADFFAVYTTTYYNPNASPTFQGNNIEIYKSSITGRSGYKDEGRVAAGLWDLYDAQNDWNVHGDPQYGAPYPAQDQNAQNRVNIMQMVNTMRFLNSATFSTFFQKLVQTLPPVTADESRQIVTYNYLDPRATQKESEKKKK